MTGWTVSDLVITENNVEFIRARAHQYLGDRPWAPKVIGEMVGDLIIHRALPVKIDLIDGWWKIAARRDWLEANSLKVGIRDVFDHVRHFPQKALNAMRSEVLVSAICDKAVTVGPDGTTWISRVKAKEGDLLPSALDLRIDDTWQRILAFSIVDEKWM